MFNQVQSKEYYFHQYPRASPNPHNYGLSHTYEKQAWDNIDRSRPGPLAPASKP